MTHNSESKLNWKKATEAERNDCYIDLEKVLNDLVIPGGVVNCQDVHCKNKEHKKASDDYMLEILYLMEKVANDKPN